jgi:hypothetical protein
MRTTLNLGTNHGDLPVEIACSLVRIGRAGNVRQRGR